MRVRELTGRTGRTVLMLVVAAAAGASAAAIAAVPGNDGVIHACYEVQQDGTTPVAAGPNVRIIDPSAGQTCNPAGAPAQAEHALSWNVTGPAGPQGVAGSPGAQGASGPAGTTVSIDGRTFTLGDGKTLTAPARPIPPLQAVPGGSPVATMTLGSGGGTSFPVLAWQLVGGPNAAARGIQIVKPLDKASPTLMKLCVNGQHIKTAVMTVRAAAQGGPQTIILTGARVDSYGTDKGQGKAGAGTVAESVSLSFSSIKVEYR
ncbi:MAG: type VI secretion system tube protein Hcp [Actinobacteria bacterium]|nr:type VI secretion system tube protein Hcp [Actinomycetota bacterium]